MTGPPGLEVDLALTGLHKATPALSTSSSVAELELLAHYQQSDDATGDERSGFALLLELSDRRLMLEMDVALDPGSELSLNFFLPDAGADTGRTKVSLVCMVAQCRDPEQLHYSARISKISQPSKRAIEKLHAELGSGRRA